MYRADSSSFVDTKNNYQILDGLRGLAAIMVVLYHIMEAFSMSYHSEQIINHGYLAVDFFFVLSGFVIGYAYDDRWGKMTLKDFFKRRLIRLHPMIIVGTVIGAVTFYFQESSSFRAIADTPVWEMLVIMLIGFTMIPVSPSMDIRGWREMYPLNGPVWSLFLEYIANILYALFIRKFSKKLLSILVFIAGCVLIHYSVTSRGGNLSGGWSLNPGQLRIGFTRLIYPFFSGLLISRVFKPGKVNNAFLWCSLLLITIFSIPRIGGTDRMWLNGLYESLSVVFIFPLIVYLGASGTLKSEFSNKVNGFLGNISYPLYIVHYPFVYMFMAFLRNHGDSFTGTEGKIIIGIIAAAVFLTTILIAQLCLKFYDIPVRRWLTKKFIKR